MLLLAILSGLIALLWFESADPPPRAPAAASAPALTEETIPPPAQKAIPATGENRPLNLQLPEEVLRAHPEVNLKEPPSPIKPLFKPSEKQTVVSVGGGLILEENPDPETPLKDQVKGAQVDIKVKID